jgi:hypothetical protein
MGVGPIIYTMRLTCVYLIPFWLKDIEPKMA